ncbi:MAG: hypothetical protein JXR96_20450, partial [Deltaproteobacteria bacterium]|nr:hypothetical protein [Deltaproteobacteria bacterium]
GLCAERELVQIREGRPIATWEIPSGWLYVPAGRLARADDGVVLIHPLEQGLQVWRWRMP